MTAQPEVVKELTRTELRRVADEFQSERDSAKRDSARMQDERDVALNQLSAAQASLTAALAERDELVHDMQRLMDAANDNLRWGGQAEKERDVAIAERDKLVKELATSVELMRRARKEVFGPFAVLVPGLAAEIDAFLTAQAAQGEKG